MGNYLKMYNESDYLSAFDLEKETIVKIVKVVQGEITGERGKKDRMPFLYFEGAKKPWAMSAKCCGKAIRAMYGKDSNNWIGKKITIYPTTCEAFGDPERDCIRVKSTVPK